MMQLAINLVTVQAISIRNDILARFRDVQVFSWVALLSFNPVG